MDEKKKIRTIGDPRGVLSEAHKESIGIPEAQEMSDSLCDKMGIRRAVVVRGRNARRLFGSMTPKGQMRLNQPNRGTVIHELAHHWMFVEGLYPRHSHHGSEFKLRMMRVKRLWEAMREGFVTAREEKSNNLLDRVKPARSYVPGKPVRQLILNLF